MAITEKDFEEKAKLLKKTDKKADTLEARALSDEELENTAGGFWRREGYANGWWIECPICGCNTQEGINVYPDSDAQVDKFYCRMCDILWGLDSDGNIWEP